MKTKVHVLPIWTSKREELKEAHVVPTVSKAGGLWSGLSPFLIGPCHLYGEHYARNMENAWQFSKVYEHHVAWSEHRQDVVAVDILPGWWEWAKNGWADERAHRYPQGKSRTPLFSYWDGEALTYIDARKVIYGPLYAEAVQKTAAFTHLQRLMGKVSDLVLLDYDAYDHRALGLTLTDVLNNPEKKMGHAFVLAMLLTNDPALKQMELRR